MKDPRGDNFFANNIQPVMEDLRAAWLAQARAVARSIIERKGYVTADDVHEACPVPDGVEPRTMGALFRTSDFRLVRYVAGARSVRQIGVYTSQLQAAE